MEICHWSLLPQSPEETLDIGMSGASTPSALRFLTHDVIKKTSLCWALMPDVCKTNRNCNTSEISISNFHVSDAYVFAQLLMLETWSFLLMPPSPKQTQVGGPACPHHVRFESKADMCGAQVDVRFVPKADIAPQKERPPRAAVSPSKD